MNIEQWNFLNTTQSCQLRSFIKAMEKQRQLSYKLDYSAFYQQTTHTTHLVCLQEGTILGYALLSQYDPSEIEITLVVPVDEQLLEALLNTIKQKATALSAPRLVFILDSNVRLHQDFCKSTEDILKKIFPQSTCNFLFSEYAMVFNREKLSLEAPELALKKAVPEEVEQIAKLWGLAEVEPDDLAKTQVYHIDGKAAGTIRIDETPERYGIYGFVVDASYRGQGLGKQIFTQIVQQLSHTSEKEIYLEVETTNAPALHLYENTGFEIKARFDYFGLKKPSSVNAAKNAAKKD